MTFPLRDDVVPLNHASYGVPTRRSLELAARIREEIEREPMAALGEALTERLDGATAAAAAFCGLPEAGFGLTANATDACAAVVRASAPHRVAVLDTEYESVRRAWEVAAPTTVVAVPLPVPDAAAVLDALDGVDCDLLQVSLVSSSAALALPVARIGAWARERCVRLVVDCAHGPGHVTLDAVAEWADFAFGTLHKWLPVPRGVGFAWARDPTALRPAAVSLSWDEPTVARRFSWPGTYDPAPRLCVPDAIEQWRAWDLTEASRLADTDLDLVPAAGPELRAPRLRAFLLDRPLGELRDALGAAGIQAWTGPGPRGETLLRIATHVHTTPEHLERLRSALR